jgi:hypothetical protein
VKGFRDGGVSEAMSKGVEEVAAQELGTERYSSNVASSWDSISETYVSRTDSNFSRSTTTAVSRS